MDKTIKIQMQKEIRTLLGKWSGGSVIYCYIVILLYCYIVSVLNIIWNSSTKQLAPRPRGITESPNKQFCMATWLHCYMVTWLIGQRSTAKGKRLSVIPSFRLFVFKSFSLPVFPIQYRVPVSEIWHPESGIWYPAAEFWILIPCPDKMQIFDFIVFRGSTIP